MFDTPQSDVRIIGHRGAAAVAPENTLASFRAAAALGVRWVEMDVSVLADGAPVIFHDEELERCSNGRGRLTEVDFAYVQQLDAGCWFAPQFSGERIPTLSEALQEIQRLGMGLNLEIKHDGPGLERLVASVLTTLAHEWRDSDKLLLSSFNHQALRLCQHQACAAGNYMSRFLPIGSKSCRTLRHIACTATTRHSMPCWLGVSRRLVIGCSVIR